MFTSRQATAITSYFPGFRRISIDDLRKTQVIQDIQQVLDGVSENYIALEEIREIPGTLNGLYLWLCLKQFNKKNFAKVRPLVNILLASNSLSESELYEVVSIAGAVSSRETFQKYLCQLRPLVVKFSRTGEVSQIKLRSIISNLCCWEIITSDFNSDDLSNVVTPQNIHADYTDTTVFKTVSETAGPSIGYIINEENIWGWITLLLIQGYFAVPGCESYKDQTNGHVKFPSLCNSVVLSPILLLRNHYNKMFVLSIFLSSIFLTFIQIQIYWRWYHSSGLFWITDSPY